MRMNKYIARSTKPCEKEEELSTNGMAREFALRLALCSAFGTQFHVATKLR